MAGLKKEEAGTRKPARRTTTTPAGDASAREQVCTRPRPREDERVVSAPAERTARDVPAKAPISARKTMTAAAGDADKRGSDSASRTRTNTPAPASTSTPPQRQLRPSTRSQSLSSVGTAEEQMARNTKPAGDASGRDQGRARPRPREDERVSAPAERTARDVPAKAPISARRTMTAAAGDADKRGSDAASRTRTNTPAPASTSTPPQQHRRLTRGASWADTGEDNTVTTWGARKWRSARAPATKKPNPSALRDRDENTASASAPRTGRGRTAPATKKPEDNTASASAAADKCQDFYCRHPSKREVHLCQRCYRGWQDCRICTERRERRQAAAEAAAQKNAEKSRVVRSPVAVAPTVPGTGPSTTPVAHDARLSRAARTAKGVTGLKCEDCRGTSDTSVHLCVRCSRSRDVCPTCNDRRVGRRDQVIYS